MLYNKDWNKSKIAPTADLLSLDGLIAWLETKDPTQRYSSMTRIIASCPMGSAS